MLSIIVAKALNNVIGKSNDIPWYIPEDLVRFKTITNHHSVIMGLLTFISILARIGKPLPNRKHFVLTSKSMAEVSSYVKEFMQNPELKDKFPDFKLEDHLSNIVFCKNFVEAQMRAEAIDAEVFVIGGNRVFTEALPFVSKIYLTQIHQEIDGDVYFPELDNSEWQRVSESEVKSHEALTYSYIELNRINNNTLTV